MKPEDFAVMAYKVPDPDSWFAHAVRISGQQQAELFLAQKVARLRPEYEAESAKPGYKTRPERDADDKAKQDAEIAAQLEEHRKREEQKARDFDAAVRSKVEEILSQRTTR